MNHQRIASTADPTITGAWDTLEIRLDAALQSVNEENLEAILAQWPEGQTVATLRPRRQGGHFGGDETLRLNALKAVQDVTGAAIDLEADLQDGAKLGHAFARDGPLIRSLHLGSAPDREVGLNFLTKCQDEHGGLQKLAFPCASFLDQLRALELTWQHSHHGKPAVTPQGLPALRALLPLAGNHATYGAAQEAMASGQPTMAEIQQHWDHWGLDPCDIAPRTYWLAVIGSPIHHSLSPRMHNANFACKGRPERMGALDVPNSPGAFRLVASVAARIGLGGASVTHPHKRMLHDVLEPDDIAAAIGAANCADFTKESCTNTDATAMQRLLPHGDVAILGSGAFAEATLWAAKQRGLSVTVCARSEDVATKWQVPFLPWDARAELTGDTLVQATTLSTELGVPATQFDHVVEAVYEPSTHLLQAAAEAGVTVTTPKQLLLAQGMDAYVYWFGDSPDEAAMQESLS